MDKAVVVMCVTFVCCQASRLRYMKGDPMLTIAHRGASGYFPEHTLEAYIAAAQMGVQFIEPDLVLTKDGKFIVHHDTCLNSTTDVSVHPSFKDTHGKAQYKGGQLVTGFFTEDFTLEEIKQLKVRQRVAERPQRDNWKYSLLTLEETLEWAIEENRQRIANGSPLLGVYIELKSPSEFNALGFEMEQAFLKVLEKYNLQYLDEAALKCPIIIQCFELETLKKLKKQTDLPLVYLMEKQAPEFSLEEVMGVVDAVGPNLAYLFDDELASTGFAERAHSYGLEVHAWDLEASFWPHDKLYAALHHIQSDGIFTEFPDVSLERLREYS